MSEQSLEKLRESIAEESEDRDIQAAFEKLGGQLEELAEMVDRVHEARMAEYLDDLARYEPADKPAGYTNGVAK